MLLRDFWVLDREYRRESWNAEFAWLLWQRIEEAYAAYGKREVYLALHTSTPPPSP